MAAKEGAMTEAEWLAYGDPKLMLEFLRGKISPRKLRLYAAACCHRIESLFAEEWCRTAVELSEKVADGLATESELDDLLPDSFSGWAATAAWDGTFKGSIEFALKATDAAANAAAGGSVGAGQVQGEQDYDQVAIDAWKSARSDERIMQTLILRHMVGNPFRPVALDPAWLQWNGGTVRKMAQAIYDDRAFDRLPILADALEEAGCTNRDLLDHCRGGGDHVRGCWAVDLLLGKE
jgi:hypothetical protein